MRGLILGASPKNESIQAFLAQHGHSTLLVEDVFSLRRFSGQAGDFQALLPGGAEDFDFAVVTEADSPPPPVFGGQAATSLYLGDKPALCRALPTDGAAVFLLDALCPSPLAATVRVLQDAGPLAGKRPVHCLYKTLSTTGRGTDALYRRAREQGARFTQYESLCVRPDDGGGFHLEAECEDGPLALSASLLFADGGQEESPAFRHCIKVLRLWADSRGRLPTTRFFLTPVRSSRRGVFLIGQDFDAQRLTDGLRSITAELVNLPQPPDKSQNTAFIRGERCALCYTCHRLCPHAALQPSETTRQMDCLPAACEGCGNCAAACPGDAIRLKDSEPEAFQNSGGKTLLAFCCQNSAALALPKALALMKQWPGGEELATGVEGHTLPCGGAVGQETLLDALLRYDKVLVASCMESACRHFEGPHHAHGQCQRLQGLLGELGLGPHRLRWVQSSHALPGALAEELMDFLQTREEAPA